MIQSNRSFFQEYLNELYPDAKCELNYKRDYELLIATVLSAQCTDKQVNKVTAKLFSMYDIFSLKEASQKDIEDIIHPVGTYTKKAKFIIEIANKLVKNHKGRVPNDKEYLMTLPGVGIKTINVVLGNLYNVPGFAVDTHVERVSKRLYIAKTEDNVTIVEQKLMKSFPKDKWVLLHHQFVLFGRYHCKARNPECTNCLMKERCRVGKKKTKSNNNFKREYTV